MPSLKDFLIAHYKMNDNAATAVVIDETGNHNGEYQKTGVAQNTNTGASTGKINGALDFDGVDEHIEIADHDDFSPVGTPFSISAFVNMRDATSFEIANKGVYNTDAEWKLRVWSDDKLEFLRYDESVDSCSIGKAYDTVLTNYEDQWIHIVATSDGGILRSGMNLYLNGVCVGDKETGSNPGSFEAIENLDHAVWVGRYSTIYADGLIDNVMFFSKELTQTEIDYLHNLDKGTEDFPPLAGGRLNRIRRHGA